jgi:DNA-binding response OmpR family regulator
MRYMPDNKTTIVLVEDDIALTEMYSLKFSEAGYNLKTASDGASGLEMIFSEKPSIILLDIMMPKMDGFAVLTELKKNDTTKNIPVLMLTNLGQKTDMEKSKELGANDYIVKASMTPSQVLEKIKNLIK